MNGLKKQAVYFVLLMIIIGVAEPGWGAATENHALRSTPAREPVNLGNGLAGWDQSGAIVIADSVEKPRHLVRVTSMHDRESLYLAFEFKDPTPMINHMDPKSSPGQAWCGDAVQIRFNTSPDRADKPMKPGQLVHLDAYWYSDGKQPVAYMVFGDLSPGGKTEKTIFQAVGHGVGMHFQPDVDGQGYLQILKVDWKLLFPDGVRPEQSLRMAIEAMWGDVRYHQHAADRVADLLNPKRPEREMLWTNPPAFGTVELSTKGGLEPGETAAMWTSLLALYEQGQKEKPAPAPAAEPAAVAPNRPCLEDKDEVSRQLNEWFMQGTAAGNQGDFYDNRDRDHSAIQMSKYPQMRRFEYTPEELAANADYGLALRVLPHVTFGNSSTASPPERGGSNPRHAMMRPDGMAKLDAQYRAANLYVYPGHHDYMTGHNGQGMYGDLFPVNSPYVLISTGSSGSDIPFLNALIHTTAAFHPKVKEILLKQGLLIPTLQALLRQSNTQVVTPEDYFTGKAHPVVFRGDQLDELKMVKAAHAMTPETIPPLARVKVIEEEDVKPGINAPENTPTERFCDTPSVVGRVFRRWDRTMRMKVSAAESFDSQGRPLKFRWALLQGDPNRVRIVPSDDGKEAELTISWHDRFPVEPGSLMETNRVDIGVFASAGAGWSAPAFVSVTCPDNELRTYDEKDRLLDIYYSAGDTRIGYETPVLVEAEGISPYHVRDWPGLLKMVADKGLDSDLLRAGLSNEEWAAAEQAVHETQALVEKYAKQREANRPPGLNARRETVRRDAIASSEPLLSKVGDRTVKDAVEGALNAWNDDPMSYLSHREAIDAETARRGPEVRKAIDKARQRLVDLGIYLHAANGGWILHPVRSGKPVVERLTRYERLELQRFHLEILNRVLLPDILARNYSFNYVDDRMTKYPPLWLTFEYRKEGEPPTVHARKTDEDRTPLPLEDP